MSDRSRHPIQRGLELVVAGPKTILRKLRNDRLTPTFVARKPEFATAAVKTAKATGKAKPDVPSAISDYSSLAASQVVPRLSGLSKEELTEVLNYEEATRGRRSILAAVRSHLE